MSSLRSRLSPVVADLAVKAVKGGINNTTTVHPNLRRTDIRGGHAVGVAAGAEIVVEGLVPGLSPGPSLEIVNFVITETIGNTYQNSIPFKILNLITTILVERGGPDQKVDPPDRAQGAQTVEKKNQLCNQDQMMPLT